MGHGIDAPLEPKAVPSLLLGGWLGDSSRSASSSALACTRDALLANGAWMLNGCFAHLCRSVITACRAGGHAHIRRSEFTALQG